MAETSVDTPQPVVKAPDETALIAVVLDRSGSMEAIRDDAIGGLNAFVAEQRDLPGQATLLLAQFDHEYELVHDGLPLAEIPPLDRASFVPRGRTALLDALGRTLNDVAERISRTAPAGRPGRVIVVVVTDGCENASREFTLDTIAKMIAARRADGWEILFLCTSEEALRDAVAMGIDGATSRPFAGTALGTRDAFRRVSRSIGNSRRSGRPVEFDDDDKKKMN